MTVVKKTISTSWTEVIDFDTDITSHSLLHSAGFIVSCDAQVVIEFGFGFNGGDPVEVDFHLPASIAWMYLGDKRAKGKLYARGVDSGTDIRVEV